MSFSCQKSKFFKVLLLLLALTSRTGAGRSRKINLLKISYGNPFASLSDNECTFVAYKNLLCIDVSWVSHSLVSIPVRLTAGFGVGPSQQEHVSSFSTPN